MRPVLLNSVPEAAAAGAATDQCRGLRHGVGRVVVPVAAAVAEAGQHLRREAVGDASPAETGGDAAAEQEQQKCRRQTNRLAGVAGHSVTGRHVIHKLAGHSVTGRHVI